jgi:hypothetical protein
VSACEGGTSDKIGDSSGSVVCAIVLEVG